MKNKNYLIKIIIFFIFIVPINVLAYSKYIIPGGETVGIEVYSKGILIVDFYEVNNKLIAQEKGFRIGDIITKINNIKVNNINDMLTQINNSKSKEINFTIERNNKELNIEYELPREDNIIKTGIFVKDKITGLGTLSFIDPETKTFGALGHEILESKTLTKFDIKDGKIYEAIVSSIKKSTPGTAGEKNASTNKNNIYGVINTNEITGIYGTYNKDITDLARIEVGEIDTITTGEATIKTVINTDQVEEFSINILSIDKKSKTKNILFEITDEKLLNETGGIVQGMSGSPILQNNKIIGAVNYVIVNDTSKGYGIFITTMLNEVDN